MANVLVWDFPLRVFHWMFAISLSLALILAFGVDDDSVLFQYHMLFGMIAGSLLLLRIVIGFLGARYARFSGLMFSPGETVRYAIQSVFGRSHRYVGHNPGTAVVALAMFAIIIGLVWTGLNMSDGSSEDVHEVLAYGMMVAIGAHFTGMILHTFRHRENIAMGMITGKKDVDDSMRLPSAQPFAGIVSILVAAFWAAVLFRGFDASVPSVAIHGLGSVQLGEHEERHEADTDHDGERGEEDDD